MSRFDSLRCVARMAATIPTLTYAQTTVWRLGTFDYSAHEFQGHKGSGSPVIDVNAADAAAQWPALQAGSLNLKAGSKAHPRTIQFRLDSASGGIYTLDLSVLVGSPRAPRLLVVLNGTPASVFLRRHVSFYAEGPVDSPINGEAREQIPTPAALLRKGENTLRITAVDDVPDENGDSAIAWDALQLLNASAPGEKPKPEFRVERHTSIPNDKVDPTRGSLPAVPSGFLGATGEGFEMETLKPAEDGNGNIIRLIETAGRGGRVRISSKLLRIQHTRLCNAAQDNEREIPLAGDGIELALKPYSIIAVRALMRPAE